MDASTSESLLSNDPEPSTARQSTYGKPMPLSLGHKVFLSYSGRDKDVVRYLYMELCRSYHGFDVAFFDEESLPKGDVITMTNILEVAKGSKLGVLLLTDDFFTCTPFPMLELEAFVDNEVPLLPLFLGMSVNEFKDKKRWDGWERKWEDWGDFNAKIPKWRHNLQYVTAFNGLESCKTTPSHRRDLFVVDQVVKTVDRIMGPALPMCGADVYGKYRLCKEVDKMFKKCSAKRSQIQIGENSGLHEYDLVGIYGFPGLGKTTLCKSLCDFYFGELNGRVCYIDLGIASQSQLDRMTHVLSRLDRGNSEDIRNLNLESDQVKTLLKDRLSYMKNPIFLAIDNISPYPESEEEALTYVTCRFPKDSKIIITARAKKTLSNLIGLLPQSYSFSAAVIQYMPALEPNEATQIFRHEFPDLRKCWWLNEPAHQIEQNLKKNVDACVNKCTIFSAKIHHPLMLKSLATFIKFGSSMPTVDWKERLAKLASEKIIPEDVDAWDRVFKVFDLTYGLLEKEEKKVFLDLALCYRVTPRHSLMYDLDHNEWVKMVHVTRNLSEGKVEKILLQLHKFGFIDASEWGTINIQDLMVEYGKRKADAEPDEFLVLEHGDPWLDDLPRTARHISISSCTSKTLTTLDIRNVEGVKVLTLLDNEGLEEVTLSRTTSARLRSMIVSVPAHSTLRCIVNEDWSSQSLKWFKVKGNVDFCFPPPQGSLMWQAAWMDPGSMFLRGCRNVELLTLDNLSLPSGYVQNIDLTPCANLRWFKVENMAGLRSIRYPGSSSCLEEVSILSLTQSEDLTLVIPADSRTRSRISCCESLRTVSLSMTPSIKGPGSEPAKPESKLSISGCPLVASVNNLLCYTGGMFYFDSDSPYFDSDSPKYKGQLYRFWTERFVDIVKEAGIDSSRCKATVTKLEIGEYNRAGQLGGVTALCLEEAQHIGPIISAMFQAQPTYFKELGIQCQQAGDGCGCDQNPPNFGTFPIPRQADCTSDDWLPRAKFYYCCPQVRDLASLTQWHSLRYLSLKGCTSVKVWPDFTVMTSLIQLDLKKSSLKEWPASVHYLPHLKRLDVRGCQRLPAKELILRGIKADHHSEPAMSYKLGDPDVALRHFRNALVTLVADISHGARDRCTVADALSELSPQLEAFFDGWAPEISDWNARTLLDVLYLIYDVCYDGMVNSLEQLQGLLSSDGFRSLPSRIWRRNPSTTEFSPYMDLDETMATLAVIGMLGLAVNDYHLRDNTNIFFSNTPLESIFIKHFFYDDVAPPAVNEYHDLLSTMSKFEFLCKSVEGRLEEVQLIMKTVGEELKWAVLCNCCPDSQDTGTDMVIRVKSANYVSYSHF